MLISKLAIYIDFSIKYKYLVGDSLNNDVRRIIWKIYLKSIMRDKIKLLCE